MVIKIDIQPRHDSPEFSARVQSYDTFHVLKLEWDKSEVSIFGDENSAEKLKMIADIFNDAFPSRPEHQAVPAYDDGLPI